MRDIELEIERIITSIPDIVLESIDLDSVSLLESNQAVTSEGKDVLRHEIVKNYFARIDSLIKDVKSDIKRTRVSIELLNSNLDLHRMNSRSELFEKLLESTEKRRAELHQELDTFIRQLERLQGFDSYLYSRFTGLNAFAKFMTKN